MVWAAYRQGNRRRPAGSALILTVVLTGLLAMVGTLFVLVSRLDKAATRASQDTRELDLAVERLLARINTELVLDVPRARDMAGENPRPEQLEYYDYPGPLDPWLASSEPIINDSGALIWPQISDITGSLNRQDRENIPLTDRNDPNDPWDEIVSERKPISNIRSAVAGQLLPCLADADGDGVADAKWFVLDDSNPDKPLFAAVRIEGHGAKLNVNAAYNFDLDDPNNIEKVNGSHQAQIDLLGLADPNNINGEIRELWEDRINQRPIPSQQTIHQWLHEVVWRYDREPSLGYTPYELSDELRLRYRYLLDYNRVNTRIENVWSNVFEGGPRKPIPHESAGQAYNLNRWARRAGTDATENDYRHICTTWNMDRQLTPEGFDPNGMLNINRHIERIIAAKTQSGNGSPVQNDLNTLVNQIKEGIALTVANRDNLAAQFAVNLVDFMDEEGSANGLDTTVWSDGNQTYYGFERQPFFGQIRFRVDASDPDANGVNGFLVELYNPFTESIPLTGFVLRLTPELGEPTPIDITLSASGNPNQWRSIPGRSSLFIINNEDAGDLLAGGATVGTEGVMLAPDMQIATYMKENDEPPVFVLEEYYSLSLIRKTENTQNETVDLYLDHQLNEQADFEFDQAGGKTFTFQRGARDTWKLVEPVWQEKAEGDLSPMASDPNRANYNLADPNLLLRQPLFADHIQSRRFVRIGDILRILTIGPGTDPTATVGQQLMDAQGEGAYRFDLTVNPTNRVPNPFAKIFQFVSALDPNRFGAPPDETRVKGRINVNTASEFVLQRLPWMSTAIENGEPVARAIVFDRQVTRRPYESIGDLMRVWQMSYLNRDRANRDYRESAGNLGRNYPDFTADESTDDLEEAHLLFAAISNLVTVRSDVFSAYILVRIGTDGPQRRFYALLDRSGVEASTDRVKVLVRQNVPDPR